MSATHAVESDDAVAHAPVSTQPVSPTPEAERAERESVLESERRELRNSLVRGYFADAPTIHALPTLYVMCGSFFAVSTLTAFLQTTVIPSTGHFAVFFFGAFTCFSSYYMAAHFLGEHARSFQRISPEKKMYTVSNLIKAGVLAAITPLGVIALWQGIVHDTWHTNTLRNLGCIYAIPDFVALIVVRRMAMSTYMHHLCVLAFCFISLYNDYEDENVFRGIAVYGGFSTFGYIVYMLLATRFLGVSPNIARTLSLLALASYVACCTINWLWQASFLKHMYWHRHHWSIYPYFAALCLVAYDDLQLCSWLLHRARTHASDKPRQGVDSRPGPGLLAATSQAPQPSNGRPSLFASATRGQPASSPHAHPRATSGAQRPTDAGVRVE